jgi:hypothetical protein
MTLALSVPPIVSHKISGDRIDMRRIGALSGGVFLTLLVIEWLVDDVGQSWKGIGLIALIGLAWRALDRKAPPENENVSLPPLSERLSPEDDTSANHPGINPFG